MQPKHILGFSTCVYFKIIYVIINLLIILVRDNKSAGHWYWWLTSFNYATICDNNSIATSPTFVWQSFWSVPSPWATSCRRRSCQTVSRWTALVLDCNVVRSSTVLPPLTAVLCHRRLPTSACTHSTDYTACRDQAHPIQLNLNI